MSAARRSGIGSATASYWALSRRPMASIQARLSWGKTPLRSGMATRNRCDNPVPATNLGRREFHQIYRGRCICSGSAAWLLMTLDDRLASRARAFLGHLQQERFVLQVRCLSCERARQEKKARADQAAIAAFNAEMNAAFEETRWYPGQPEEGQREHGAGSGIPTHRPARSPPLRIAHTASVLENAESRQFRFSGLRSPAHRLRPSEIRRHRCHLPSGRRS